MIRIPLGMFFLKSIPMKLTSRFLPLTTLCSALEEEEANESFTAPLLEDIEKLSTILGAVIKSENKEVYEVEKPTK